MRLLFDARLPRDLAFEASGALEFVRWSGADVSDADLLRAAAQEQFAGVILLDRDSLAQADLRTTARAAGIALVAVAAEGPLEAKRRLVRNLASLHRALLESDCLLVLANEVRRLDFDVDDN